MPKIDLLQGTLDMLILRVLNAGELHGWGIPDRIQVLSKNVLSVGEGSKIRVGSTPNGALRKTIDARNFIG